MREDAPLNQRQRRAFMASCEGKQRFESARLAHEVKSKRNKNLKNPKREAYHCSFCGGYHLGQVPNKSFRSNPKLDNYRIENNFEV